LRPGARPREPGNRKPGKTATAPKRGKPVNIYLHDADQERIRDLAAYLAEQISDESEEHRFKASTS
jgi:hypothetical protein